MDDRGQLNRGGQIRGGKDADGVLLVSWEDSAPDVNGTLVGDLVTLRGSGYS